MSSRSFLVWLRENLLLLLIMIGVILGFLIGLFVNETVQKSKDPLPMEIALYISFPGEIFLRMLRVLILPLIVSSVIVSLAILDKKSAAKLGRRAGLFFLFTTFIAVTISVVLASVLQPGVTNTNEKQGEEKNGNAIHAIFDFIRNIFPDNIVEAAIDSTATKFASQIKGYRFVNKSSANYKDSAKNLSVLLKNEVINPWSITPNMVQIVQEENARSLYGGLEKYNSANILGILVFSVIFGAIVSTLGADGKPMKDFFTCLFSITMKMVDLSMWFSPVGICSIIAGKLAGMQDIKGSVESLGMFMVTVTVASLLHSLVVMPGIYFVMLRKNPFRFLSGVSKAILTAFGTGSSSATIPIALTCLEQNHKIDRRVSQFIVPVGTTVNMDGGGIYIAATAVYLAQSQSGTSIDFGSAVLVCFSATLSSVAMPPITAAVPIITKTIVLQTIGIRSADITLILVVDWLIGRYYMNNEECQLLAISPCNPTKNLMDRVTTPVNVWGNCISSAVVEHLSRDDLTNFDGGKRTYPTSGACVVDFAVNTAVDIEKEETQL